jgi:hypothetical protein
MDVADDVIWYSLQMQEVFAVIHWYPHTRLRRGVTTHKIHPHHSENSDLTILKLAEKIFCLNFVQA